MQPSRKNWIRIRTPRKNRIRIPPYKTPYPTLEEKTPDPPSAPPPSIGERVKSKNAAYLSILFLELICSLQKVQPKNCSNVDLFVFVFFVFTLFQFQSLYTPYKIACHLPYNDFLCYILRHFSMIFNSKYMNCLRKNITSQN